MIILPGFPGSTLARPTHDVPPARSCRDWESPCVICNRLIDTRKGGYDVHLHCGGEALVTDEEDAGPAHNYKTGKPYSGINAVLLAPSAYLTFKQARDLGGHVRKGAKGQAIVFYRPLPPRLVTRADGTEHEENGCVLQSSYVFPIAECAGLPVREVPARTHTPIAEAERILAGYTAGPTVRHGAQERACYTPCTDEILLPLPTQFASPEAYYATRFHEEAHGTGHPSRLGRFRADDPISFGDERYSKEELVAEMGAAFLYAQAGIDRATLPRSASYLDGWITALRGDHTLVVKAASAAQKAANHILGIAQQETSETGAAA